MIALLLILITVLIAVFGNAIVATIWGAILVFGVVFALMPD